MPWKGRRGEDERGTLAVQADDPGQEVRGASEEQLLTEVEALVVKAPELPIAGESVGGDVVYRVHG